MYESQGLSLAFFFAKKGRGTEAPRPKNAELPCRDAALTSLEKCKAGEAFLPNQKRTAPNEVLLNCVASRLYHETIGKAKKEMCLTVRQVFKKNPAAPQRSGGNGVNYAVL